ncbi:MAG: hypothetical protein IKM36_04150 [Oscillospiraceae bacterium]|nr:hypothetical protein [Oscillospiraceae bacterium]MBR2977636.1 hypothetical protein [Oscillospiraceae bacterium]MBR3849669.1 hypothetical protein [Oscillospiraceae bacterium]
MELLLMNASGTRDLSRFYQSMTVSGSKSSCARSVSFTIPATGADPYLPHVQADPGDRLLVREGERTILDGFLASVSVGSEIGTGKTIKAYDRGLQMNNNSAAYAFRNAAPAEIVRKVCEDFGIAVGDLADTGTYSLTRNFIGVSLYQILATAYTLASGSTGKQYHLRFEADKLCVRELAQRDETLYIRPGSNLLSATSSVSLEKLVNRVAIVDKSGNRISVKDNAESQQRYGVWTKTVQQSDTAAETADETLREFAEPQYSISVQGLGDWRCISGECVGVQDRESGLWGVFAIENDTHTLANGIHTMQLTLTLKNLMAEVKAGSDK